MADKTAEARKKSQAMKAALGPVDKEMRDIYHKGLAPLDHPTTKTPTTVVGGPAMAQDVETLMSIAPFLRGMVNNVMPGPTEGVWNARNAITKVLGDEGMPSQEWPLSGSFAGMWDPDRREIGISPDYVNLPGLPEAGWMGEHYDKDRFRLLAHEFGHAAGIEHGREMSNLEGVARMREEYVRRNGAKK